MSQGDILELLEKKKYPLSRFEICKILDEDGTKVSHSLKKLIFHNEVKYIEINREQSKEFLKFKAPKRRMRLYCSIQVYENIFTGG